MIRIVPFLLTLKIKIWTALNKEKSSEANGLRGNLVGVTGFEPAASTSQMSRATNCATPRFIKLYQRRLEKSSSTVVVKYRVKPQKPRFETAKNPVFMRVFKVRGLSRSLSPKPGALPTGPHPEI